jgi:predicted metal-binding membrane protein
MVGGRGGALRAPPHPRRWIRRNPELTAVALVAAGWVTSTGLHRAPAGAVSHGAVSARTGLEAVLALPAWTSMCVAMMVPAAMPAIHHVGTNSLRWRRQRAMAEFLGGYVAAWVGYGLVVLAVLALVRDRVPERVLLAAALGAAAGWQLLPYQRRFLRRCHRTVPLPPHGWRAAAGCVRFGWLHGRACTGVCGPLMLVMATATAGMLWWMMLLSAASASLRLTRPNERTRTRVGLALGMTALILLLQ